MAKYRKKHLVEAVQFTGETPYPEGVTGRWNDPMGGRHDGIQNDRKMTLDVDFRAVVDTLEGELRVSRGDWIVTGIQGERWPVKPDIFAATYELVAEI